MTSGYNFPAIVVPECVTKSFQLYVQVSGKVIAEVIRRD